MTDQYAQHIYLRLRIAGSQSVTLDRRSISAFRTTNSLLSGAGEADLDCYVRPGDQWPWGVRAMDSVQIDAAVLAQPVARVGEDRWQQLYTGVLTDVPVAEAPDQGFHLPLKAATNWHILEAATESPATFSMRYQQSNMLVGDLLARLSGYAGLARFDNEGGADLNTGLIALDAIDQDGFVNNPQYQNYAQVMASLAKMAGRELYADETGQLVYRLSHYADSPAGVIPSERLLSVSASIDTDEGLVNRVQVRWGLQESQFVSGNAPADGQEITLPDGSAYDRAHYRDRLLIIPAPWIQRQADADWLAKWVLAWGMSNTRPAIVTVNFWPEVRIGQVYTLHWPKGSSTNYYISSVVHQVTTGGAAVTILGCTYGRAPNVTWNLPTAPANFGQYTAQAGDPNPAQQVYGDAWQVTYYTPADPGQPPLPTYDDNPDLGPDLRAASGARYWRDGWDEGAGQPLQDYSVRPCAMDPTNQIPELGNVTLSMGDRLRLDSGIVVQCADVGGAVKGRHLDVFFWTVPSPAPPSPERVQYLKVANYAGVLPDAPGGGSGTGVPLPTPPTGPQPGEQGDQQLADFATGTAGTLRLWGSYYADAQPLRTGDLGTFCTQQGYVLPNGDGAAQCTIFVRYCLRQSGYPWANFGNGDQARNLTAQGYLDVTFSVPALGDVAFWGPPGSDLGAGQNPAPGAGPGHVAIITAVTLPDASGAGGSVTVAQGNCTQRTQAFPLVAWGQGYQIGSNRGFGPWLGIVRPRHGATPQ